MGSEPYLLLRPKNVEEKTEGDQKDGGPNIDSCPLSCWISLGWNQDCQGDETERQQRIDGGNDLRFNAVLVLESTGKVFGSTAWTRSNVGCATDAVPHVTRREHDHGTDGEKHPDGLGRLEKRSDVGTDVVHGTGCKDDAGSGDGNEFAVEGFLILELSLQKFVEMVGDVGSSESTFVKVERNMVRDGFGFRRSREGEQHGSVLQLELLEDLLSTREFDLDKDMLGLDRLVLVPLLGDLFKLGLECDTWGTFDAARSGGEESRDGKITGKLDDGSKLLGVNVEVA